MTVSVYPPAAETAGCTASVETLGSTDETYPGTQRDIRITSTGYRWSAVGTCDAASMDRGGWMFKKWVITRRDREVQRGEVVSETTVDVGGSEGVIESAWVTSHYEGAADWSTIYDYHGEDPHTNYFERQIQTAVAVFDRVLPATGEIVRNANGTISRSEGGSIFCKGWTRISTQYP